MEIERDIKVANRPKVVINAKTSLRFPSVVELYKYRDLFRQMVSKDITIQYRQTILGFFWAILNPVLSTILFYFIFRRLAKISTDQMPASLFYLVGLLPWTYFSQSINNSSNSLISASQLLNKVYFPRIFIPVTPLVSRLVDFFIVFTIVIISFLAYGWHLGAQMVYLPVPFLLMLISTAGFAIWLSSLALQYRDIRFVAVFLIQFMLYAAPVVWPTSLIPLHYRALYGFYPMSGIIESFRACLLGTSMPWDLIVAGYISSVLLLVSGLLYFGKVERKFADIV